MGFLDYILRPDFLLFIIAIIIVIVLYIIRRPRSFPIIIEDSTQLPEHTPDTQTEASLGSGDIPLSSPDSGYHDISSSQRTGRAPQTQTDYEVEVSAQPKGIKLNQYFIVRATISGIILAAALFIILKGTHPKASMEWAYGSIGLIIGYWLK